MRCVVICQPFASAIIEGIKDVENRTWVVRTGPLAIMAGKSTAWLNDVTPKQRELMNPLFPFENLPYGMILGTVDVVDIRDLTACFMTGNPWAFGPVGWILRNPRKLVTPIPFRGRQGIFEIPDITKLEYEERVA